MSPQLDEERRTNPTDKRRLSISLDHVMNEIKRRGKPDLAKKTGTDHELAQKLWNTGIHEARILASMIDDPSKVSENQMEEWASDFDSWDLVDGCCGNLFHKTEFAIRKAHEWSKREEEYVKRAGFVMMA
jgi:3-methyladenine DNA glycosylase AlkD